MQHANRGRRLPRVRGFTLIELLISVLILGLAIISLGQLYIASMWTTQKARYLSVATKRAQSELERAEDLGLMVLQNGPTDASYPMADYTYYQNMQGVSFTVPSLPGGQGTVNWASWPPNTSNNQYLLKVDINVTWQGSSQSRSQVAVSTLVTNKR